jgi:hypothetical protein
MTGVPVPRFRGRAVLEGAAWKWELFITIGPTEPIVMVSPQSFISRVAALTDMKAMLPGIMKTSCEAMGLPAPTGVHDLNAGMMKGMEQFVSEPVREEK